MGTPTPPIATIEILFWNFNIIFKQQRCSMLQAYYNLHRGDVDSSVQHCKHTINGLSPTSHNHQYKPLNTQENPFLTTMPVIMMQGFETRAY